jgi:hypothetical protein
MYIFMAEDNYIAYELQSKVFQLYLQHRKLRTDTAGFIYINLSC